MRAPFLTRRTVLRGCGAAIALPFLDAMMPRGVGVRAAAAAGATPMGGSAPKRAIFVFFPNGMNPAAWRPTIGADGRWIPSQTLAPLNGFQEVISVHSGLRHRHAEANGDGPGDHARSAACFLTGMQPRKTAGDDIRAGLSVDQAIADELGRTGQVTRFRSLELGTEPAMTAGNCDSGYSCAYSANISWRSPTLPNGKETDPEAAFRRLFGDRGMTEEERRERAQSRRSILDGAMEQVRRLGGIVGQSDRTRLDEYLDGVRTLERRVALDATVQRDVENIPGLNGGPVDYAGRTDLLSDIMAVALQTDSTRVATFMLANEGSNRSYAEIGVSSGHHEVSHHGDEQAKLDAFNRITAHQTERFAALLRALQARQEGEGTLLDSTLVLYGSAITDGNRHDHRDLPILIAGGSALGHRGGAMVNHARDTPLCNLHRGIAEAVGAPLTQFGDATGVALVS